MTACFFPHFPSPLPARRGFTLIEILVVAALIALFSGLAVYSIQYLRTESMRKASIADARTIGSALSTFHIDNNFFPKIGYLSYTIADINRFAGNNYTTITDNLPPEFDALGLYGVGSKNKKIIDGWNGPYLPSPRQRQVIAGGYKGYFTRMKMPAPSNLIIEWPADPWGNPYVVYLVNVEKATMTPSWATSPTGSPNYIALVVSYGKNGIPGGVDDKAKITNQINLEGMAARLFIKGNVTDYDFEALANASYTVDNLRVLHNKTGWETAGAPAAWISASPVAPATNTYFSDYLLNNLMPGILDSESDDIVYQIP